MRILLLALPLLVGCTGNAWDGHVARWGTLREVLREGKVEGKVRIAEAAREPGAVGIGALADLAGEITVIEGEIWLARPRGDDGVATTSGAQADDQAAFLALATVPAWRSFRLESALEWEALEGVVAARAEEAGLAGMEAFPFVVEGQLERVEAHVLNRACPFAADPARRGEPVRSVREQVRGNLVGLYSTLPPGTLAHHGSRTHVHVVLGRAERGGEGEGEGEGGVRYTGHVDRARVAPGAVLRLPQR